MKRLYLLRHAKTQPDAPEGDHERALTERGRIDAALMARTMVRRAYVPDLILCSTARRTFQTLEILLPVIASQSETRLEPGLYLADARAILQRAGAVEGGVRSLLFIGHNPGMEDLAQRLAGDTDLGARVAEKFPTACLAAFQSEATTWAAAVRSAWKALDILRPSELRD